MSTKLLAGYAGVISLLGWNINMLLGAGIKSTYLSGNNILNSSFLSATTFASLVLNWLMSVLVVNCQNLFLNAKFAYRLVCTLLVLFMLTYMGFGAPLLNVMKFEHAAPIMFGLMITLSAITAGIQSMYEGLILTRLSLGGRNSHKDVAIYLIGTNLSGTLLTLVQIIALAVGMKFDNEYKLSVIILVLVSSGLVITFIWLARNLTINQDSVYLPDDPTPTYAVSTWEIFARIKWFWLANFVNFTTVLFVYPALCFIRPSVSGTIEPVLGELGLFKIPLVVFLNFALFAAAGNFSGMWLISKIPYQVRSLIFPITMLNCCGVGGLFASRYIAPNLISEFLIIAATSYIGYMSGFTHVLTNGFSILELKRDSSILAARGSRLLATALTSGLLCGAYFSLMFTLFVT